MTEFVSQKRTKAKEIEVERNNWIKKGVQIYHNFRPGSFHFNFVDWTNRVWTIDLAILPKENNSFYYTYSICSPKDKYFWRVAKARLGHRLFDSSRVCFVSYNIKHLVSKPLALFAIEHFVNNALVLPGIPKALRIQLRYNYLAKDLFRQNY